MIQQRRNPGWLATVMFAILFVPQAVIAQKPATKDNRPMLFGFMVDGQMVQAQVVAGKVTATVGPTGTNFGSLPGLTVTRSRRSRAFPKERMKVSKGLVRFLDKEGNVAAELTHWNGGGNLTVAPRRVPVRLGITLAGPKMPGARGRLLIGDRGQAVPVGEVAPDGPADKAGMQAGDLIVEINGQKPATEELLRQVLKKQKPGDQLKLRVSRDDKELELTATLEAVPEEANPFNLTSGRLDPLVNWRRGQIVRAKKDIEMLAAQQAALRALLRKQAATVDEEAKEAKDKKKEAVDVFRRIQSELKKSSEQADKRKKELDAKLDELKVEEARQNAMVWLNQARLGLPHAGALKVGIEQFGYKTKARKPAPGKAKKPETSKTKALQGLVLVDPRLTTRSEENRLDRQVRDLEKRMARIETLLEESLSRQREAEKRASRARQLSNRKNELDAKIRELKRIDGGEGKEAKGNEDAGRKR